MSVTDDIATILSHRQKVEAEDPPPTVNILLDRAVRVHADRVFWQTIGTEGSWLTYRSFHASVLRCTAGLRGFGIERGAHVAIMMPNIPAMAISWLAVLRLGAVVVAVNTQLTPHEVLYALTSSDTDSVIVHRDYLPILEQLEQVQLPFPRHRVIVFGDDRVASTHNWSRLVEATPLAPSDEADIDPDALATLLYTSGSTGLPKACMLPHRYWTLIGLARARQGPPPQRILIDTPLYYMGAQWRMFMGIYLGATLCVAPRPTLAHFTERLLDHAIEFCGVTAPIAKLPDDVRYRNARLRWVCCSGLPGEKQLLLEKRFGAPVRELYGSTELGSTITMPAAATALVGSGSCGWPAEFRQCRIVNADGHDVPRGQPGELWVRGAGTLLGYYKNPQANNAAFSSDWFRTGDLFHQDSDGFFYMLGRIKDVIRRNGENIAASEVEAAFEAFNEVAEAAAIPVPDAFRGEEVKVYVVLQPGLSPAALPPEHMIERCRQRLATYKLPRYIEYIDAFPRTASNKIAKQVLKASREETHNCYDLIARRWGNAS